MASPISDLLYRFLPRPIAMPRDTSSGPIACRRLLILCKNDNPTFSYYFQSRLEAIGGAEINTLLLNSVELDNINPDGLFVIICRYINRRCMAWLEKHRNTLAGIALFIDDDFAAIVSGGVGPLSYRMSVINFGLLHLKRLNRSLTSVWVSTEALRRIVDGGNVEVLSPAPSLQEIQYQSEGLNPDIVRVSYHATGIHAPEHRFLVPVITEVTRRHSNVHFEVVASGQNARIWQRANISDEQLKIVPQMSWRSYRAFAPRSPADITLVPLLESRTNAARSDTKRIDVARSGAAAVFSQSETYDRYRQANELHIANHGADWIQSIEKLITDPKFRHLSRDATRTSVRKMIEEADLSFPGINFRSV